MTKTIYFKGNVQTDEAENFRLRLINLCNSHDGKAELEFEDD